MITSMQNEITGIVTQVNAVSEATQTAHAMVGQNSKGLDALYGAITRFKIER
jgi:hypothetical protein